MQSNKSTRAFERYLSKFRRDDTDDDTIWPPTVFEFPGDAIELDEIDDQLVARMALPGLSKGDFKVEVTQDRLVIRGGKKQSSKKQSRGYACYEERQAAFARAVSLPCEVDRDGVKARYKNGLLTVTMPKLERARKKRIKIAVSA